MSKEHVWGVQIGHEAQAAPRQRVAFRDGLWRYESEPAKASEKWSVKGCQCEQCRRNRYALWNKDIDPSETTP